MHIDTNLVWIDLEMTGLNSDKDVILEIASIVTDSSLTIIEEGPVIIINQPEECLKKLDPVVERMHKKSGLFDEVRVSRTPLKDAEARTLSFIKSHCEQHKAMLCGNSVWQDRDFLKKYMPSIIDYLHYRLIDVSSIKEVIKRWYPDDEQIRFKKSDDHRALGDIRESIAELKHYRKYFFV
jgi:oligoribonuclease